jgi:hypothetical protein
MNTWRTVFLEGYQHQELKTKARILENDIREFHHARLP